MSRRFFSIAILVLTSFVLSAVPARADAILGCPKGLDEDQFWVMMSTIFSSMTEKYDRKTDSMLALPDGWHRDVNKTMLRLGYGIAEDIDVGLVLTHMDIDAKTWNKDKEKWNEFKDTGWDDPWLTVKRRCLHEQNYLGFDEVYVSVGAGFKLPTAINVEEVKHGISNGAGESELGILTNWTKGRWEFCNHLKHRWRDTAPVIKGWKYSGQDLTNRLYYKFKIGYDLTGEGIWQVGIKLGGWMDMQDVKLNPKTHWHKGLDGKKCYSHNVTLGLEYSPTQTEHQKFKLGCAFPYSVTNVMSPDYTITLIGMWVW
ncbi:hypothetical protein J7L05_00975 [bacterium]|nr:hypothetical protein [bacterium]